MIKYLKTLSIFPILFLAVACGSNGVPETSHQSATTSIPPIDAVNAPEDNSDNDFVFKIPERVAVVPSQLDMVPVVPECLDCHFQEKVMVEVADTLCHHLVDEDC